MAQVIFYKETILGRQSGRDLTEISANIGRKVIRNEDVILRLDKSLAARPVRVNPLRFFSV